MPNHQPDESHDLRKVMAFIYKENPKLWPHGLTLGHFDDARVIRGNGGSLVGFLGWQVYNKPYGKLGTYSIGVYPWHRGKGIAKEALKKFLAEKRKEVDHVGATIVEGNTASERLAEALNIPIARTIEGFAFTKPEKSASVVPMQKSANPLLKQILLHTGLAGGAYGLSRLENSHFGYGEGASGINSLANVASALSLPMMWKYRAAHPALLPGAATMFTGKQMAAYGVDRGQKAVDAFTADAPTRKAVADTNLEQSKTDLERTKLELAGADPEMKKKILMAALGLGVPALGLYAWNSLKPKGVKPKSTTTTRDAPGDPNVNRRKSKIRIDVPYSALPEGFIEGLANADDRPFARTNNITVPA